MSLRPQITDLQMNKGKTSKNRRNKKSRRAGRNNAYTGFQAVPTLFPEQKRGVMTYGVQVSLVTTATAPSAYVFRANSVFDPDFTAVTGTKAACFDQISAIYGRYRVTNVRAEITWDNVGQVNGNCFVVASTSSNIGVSWNTILAQRHVWFRPVAIASGFCYVKHCVSTPIHKLWGVPKKQVLMDDQFSALATTNPVNQAYIHVGFMPETAAAASVSLSVRILYDVIWTLPKVLTQT